MIGVSTVPGGEYDREIPVASGMVNRRRVRGVVDVDNDYFEIPLTRGVFVILHPDVGMICFHHVLVRFESELSRRFIEKIIFIRQDPVHLLREIGGEGQRIAVNGIIVGSLRYELDPFVLIHVHGADLTQRGRIVRVHDRKMDVDGISAAVVIVNVKAESVIPDVVVRGADPQGAVVGVEKVILFVLQIRYSGLGYVNVVTE